MGTDRSGVKTAWSCNSLETRTSISRRRAKEAQGRLLQAGLIRQNKAGKHPRFDFVLQKDAEKVYLPNEFIDGAADETAPLELVRQGGVVETLRLLVDLYSVTNFADDGGVNPDIVWQEFKGEKLYEIGEFAIWGFGHSGGGTVRYSYPVVSFHEPDEPKDVWEEFWGRSHASWKSYQTMYEHLSSECTYQGYIRTYTNIHEHTRTYIRSSIYHLYL